MHTAQSGETNKMQIIEDIMDEKELVCLNHGASTKVSLAQSQLLKYWKFFRVSS